MTKFRTARTRDLLTYLALCGQPVPREELVAWFWPDLEEEEIAGGEIAEGNDSQSRKRRDNSLRQSLSSLSRALNGTDNASPIQALLQLDADHTVALRAGRFITDVAEFDALLAQAGRAFTAGEKRVHLRQAVQLRRGVPLAQFDCPALNHWAEAQRYRLEMAYEAAHVLLADLAQADLVLAAPILFAPSDVLNHDVPDHVLGSAPPGAHPVALLNRRERLLRRLSVFPGSFSPEAAAAVCPEPSAPALLAGLVQEGTIDADGTRLRLPLSWRTAAWECLDQVERDRLSSRLAHWAWSLTHAASNELTPEAEANLLAERQNVTAALAWCLGTEEDALKGSTEKGNAGKGNTDKKKAGKIIDGKTEAGKDASAGVRLAGPLWRAWAHWNAPEEGLAWILKALIVSQKAAPLEAWALYYAAGQLCLGAHRPEQAREYLKEALAEAHDGEQAHCVAWALHSLGVAAYHRGEWEAAGQAYTDALEAFGGLPAGVATVIADQGDLRRHQGDRAGAQALYERSLTMRQAAGYALGEAEARYRLGAVLLGRGEPEAARAHLDRALAIREREGDRVGIGDCLELLGRLEAERGGHGLALFLLGRCLAQFEEPDKWPSRARALGTLGDILAQQGSRAEAARRYQEGLDLWAGNGHEDWASQFRKRLNALTTNP